MEVAEDLTGLGVVPARRKSKQHHFPISLCQAPHGTAKGDDIMYNAGFVASIKVDGDFKKEDKLGVVSLPFDSEYEVYLKNEHKNHKAMAEVFIDGENITKKGKLILNEGSYFNLDCFLEDLKSNHRFKFVKKGNCNPHNMQKKDREEHSVVEVKFYKEKKLKVEEHHHHHNHYIDVRPWGYPYPAQPWTPPIIWCNTTNANTLSNLNGSGTTSSIDLSNVSYTASNSGNVNCKGENLYCSSPVMDFCSAPINEGVTDKGSKSYQQFTYCAGFDTDDCVSIRIVLSGYEAKIEPMLVLAHCGFCGASVNDSFKFCSICGKRIRD